jgi:muramoyltetrapeptide carboxypeptidase
VLPRLDQAARAKTYLGYSDAGSLLGALYGLGFANLAHGPMPIDLNRDGGEAAVHRALAWLIDRDPGALEPSLSSGAPAAAFNLTILSELIGTPYQPDLTGHVLMLEEVSEYHYAIDRDLFHVTSNPAIRQVVGIRLGRCSAIPPNVPDFGQSEEEIARHWCARAGIAYLGRADIGHDADNKVVPFG